mmetsp:Transcript_96163/g.311857  ORF Transcript_96163/g.311857 Transcript_96163/m.311857 type:complete len:312 (+) Transcript_96163:454-1389(+)
MEGHVVQLQFREVGGGQTGGVNGDVSQAHLQVLVALLNALQRQHRVLQAAGTAIVHCARPQERCEAAAADVALCFRVVGRRDVESQSEDGRRADRALGVSNAAGCRPDAVAPRRQGVEQALDVRPDVDPHRPIGRLVRAEAVGTCRGIVEVRRAVDVWAADALAILRQLGPSILEVLEEQIRIPCPHHHVLIRLIGILQGEINWQKRRSARGLVPDTRLVNELLGRDRRKVVVHCFVGLSLYARNLPQVLGQRRILRFCDVGLYPLRHKVSVAVVARSHGAPIVMAAEQLKVRIAHQCHWFHPVAMIRASL